MSKREKENMNVKEISSKQKDLKKRLKYEWQQSDSELTLTFYPGNSKTNYNVENVKFNSTESSCSIMFKDGRSWNCDLYRVVVPEGTSIQFKSSKVILKMVKKAPETWKQLEARKEDEISEDSNIADSNITETQNLLISNNEVEKHLIELQSLNHTFYEKNPESLVVVVYIKNLKKDDLSVAFEDNTFTLKFKTSNQEFLNTYESSEATADSTFMWLVHLKASIKPKQCKFKVLEKKIEIFLEKENPNRWNGIEGIPTESQLVETMSSKWVPAAKVDIATLEALETPKMASSSIISEISLEQLGGGDEIATNDSRKETKPTCLVSPLNKNQIVGEVKLGLTGLDNLGNTCFMNSVLQCLANTVELKDFFLKGKFQRDINVENPLGLNGHLAVTFAVLLKNLWMGHQHSYAPSKLKMLIGKKVNQFSGFAQHDTHEFLAFFLDILHEDLNRVLHKPYIVNTSSDDLPDEIAAEEAWKNYMKRNDSIIVDLFQGQYKSKLVCPSCSKVSITFDPFLYLSLPLPKDNGIVPVYFFNKDSRRVPRKYLLKVPKDSSFGDLKARLASKTKLPVDRLRGFSITQREPIMALADNMHLSYVFTGEKIFMFEVYDETLVGEPIVELTVVQRLQVPELQNECSFCYKERLTVESKLKRCTKCMRVAYCDVQCQRSHWPTHKNACFEEAFLLGTPFFVSLPKSQATFSVICRLLEGYSSHSVDVFQPPVNLQSTKLNQSFESLATQQDESGTIEEQVNELLDEAIQAKGDMDKAMSDIDLSSLKAEDAAGCSKIAPGQQPVRLVIGQQSEKERFTPPFYIRPVDNFGQNLLKSNVELIEDKGNEPLDLSRYQHIAMDWKNNSRCPKYVMVRAKELDYEAGEEEKVSLVANLDDCLELFTEPEVLTSKDSWYCPSCKEHREATKQLSLWRLPPVLIIQLKRFSYGGFLHFREKLDKMIDFPIRSLDLSPYVCPSAQDGAPIYDLYGVVNHEGGIFGGHYTSFARCLDPLDTRRSEIDWRLFDDSRVSFVPESSIVSEAAYVLFYRQRTNKPFVSRLKHFYPMQVKSLRSSDTTLKGNNLPVEKSSDSLHEDNGRAEEDMEMVD